MYLLFSDMYGAKNMISVPEGMSWRLVHDMYDGERVPGYHELRLVVGTDEYVISESEDWMTERPTLVREMTCNHYDELISAVFEKMKEGGAHTLDLDEIEKELVERYGIEWE